MFVEILDHLIGVPHTWVELELVPRGLLLSILQVFLLKDEVRVIRGFLFMYILS